MAVSKRLRFEIFRRDGHACRYCGATAKDSELHVDHVTPEALGGTDDPENLVTACKDCNAGKAAISPDQGHVQGVSDDALRWAKAVERAAEIKAAEQEKRDAYIDAFDEAWLGWHLVDDEAQKIPRPRDWKGSLESFYDAGLDIDTVIRLIEVAMNKKGIYNNKTFRYFCGCCWNTIRERQAIARSLIEYDDKAGEG